MVDWDYFDRFKEVNNEYLPDRGEGETKATQIVTAVNKLVYKWYNDGDVFDNTYGLDGWCNDLSSYANWLYDNTEEAPDILNRITDICRGDEYEELLKDLADVLLDTEFLEKETGPATGSIYDCEGPFHFEEYEEEEEDWYEDDEEEGGW